MQKMMKHSISCAISLSNGEPFFDPRQPLQSSIKSIPNSPRSLMGGKKLGFGNSGARYSREELAKKTWRLIRSEGHIYVDLRRDGKGFVYFCCLCMSPCYSEHVLRSHLGGNFHSMMYDVAKATLFGANPWPFNDGMLFFDSNVDVEEKDTSSQGNWKMNLLDDHEYVDNLAVVVHNGVSNAGGNGCVNENVNSFGGESWKDGVDELIVPNVIWMDAISDLRAKLVGYGMISAIVLDKDGVPSEMQKIWCEWVGNRERESDDVLNIVQTHDFAIVTFKYNYDLGIDLYKDVSPLLDTGVEDSNDGGDPAKRRKISCSDSEDASKALSWKSYSSGEDTQGSSTTNTLAGLILELRQHGDEILKSKEYIPNTQIRKIVREEQRVASKRTCYICKQKMLKGKDVATMMNLKTGRVACTSRNSEGAFHVFHISCLIHWILLCEYEQFMHPPIQTKVRGKSNRRKKNEERVRNGHITSVLCPDCQGTGLPTEGELVEQPDIILAKIVQYQLKVAWAHRAWMKNPEELKNCSTGFSFPVHADKAEVRTEYKNFIKIYRVIEDGS